MPPQQLSRKRHNQKGCLKKNIIFLHMVNLKELNEFRMAIKVLDIHISKVPPVVTLAIGRPLAGQREVTSCNILQCICFFEKKASDWSTQLSETKFNVTDYGQHILGFQFLSRIVEVWKF